MRSYPSAFIKVICGRNIDLEKFKAISVKAANKGILVEKLK